jgi:hypothetical protein
VSAEKVAHTPGPWVAQASEHGEYPHVYRPERIDKDGLKYWDERICVVYPSDADDERVHHPVASANARLIASAPELLALAKRYASDCAKCDGEGHLLVTFNEGCAEYEECPACADIRATIAKAEGGA